LSDRRRGGRAQLDSPVDVVRQHELADLFEEGAGIHAAFQQEEDQTVDDHGEHDHRNPQVDVHERSALF